MTTAPAATTAQRPMRQPSSTTAFAPMSTSSSTTTGVALAGSITPASTAPAPMWQRAPTIALPPSTAPMSIMVPAPTLAPMLRMAPIMMTAPSPISTCSRMMAPGSIRAFSPFVSSMGTAELRQVLSITISAMASCCASMAGPMSRQSPNTIFVPSPAGKTLAFGKLVGKRSQM